MGHPRYSRGPNHCRHTHTTPATPRNAAHSLPVEIWYAIFTQVCDPRGKDAAAISQVSRFFYQAIAPYRLESLVIYGESQIKAFCKSMKVMPQHVPRAKHLYIGFIPDSAVTDCRTVCDAVIDGWIQNHEETRAQRDERIRQNSILSTFGFHPLEYTNFQRDVVDGIVSEHSKTLQTLTYLSTVGHIKFQVLGHLPSLRNLTVVCLRYDSTLYGVYDNIRVPRRTQFPLLERLHLSSFDTESLFKYDEFRRFTPGLTHLRLSGRQCYPQLEKLPSHTNLLIQMILVSTKERQMLVPYMRRILSDERYSQRITLLDPGYGEDGRYGFFDALLDWLDVSSGGNAFWGVTSQVTIHELATW